MDSPEMLSIAESINSAAHLSTACAVDRRLSNVLVYGGLNAKSLMSDFHGAIDATATSF